MSGVLHFDAQSVLAAWVAQRLHVQAPAHVALHEERGQGVMLRWESASGTAAGLEAVLQACAAADPAGARWLQRYRRSGVWRSLLSRAYGWAERNRGSALWLLQRLFPEAPATWAVSAWLFLRLLAVTFFCAFASLAVQVKGLFGSDGVVPLARVFAATGEALGPGAWWQAPSWLWFSARDEVLVALPVLGAALSVALLIGVLPRAVLCAQLTLYLSFVTLGAPFLSFQWDTLLIETAFLAIFLAPQGRWVPWPSQSPPVWPRWLLRWLLFRLMFLSGVVKLTSGDPAWRTLTALDFHLWTQPLPSWGAFWMARWGEGALKAETALTLVIELVFPFLLFGNRPLRRIAVLGFLALLAAIAFTGSYGFLGLLTAALCVLALDDRELRWLPVRRVAARAVRGRVWRWAALPVLAVVFLASAGATWARLRRSWDLWPPLAWAHRAVSPLLVANAYGMFEVMTKERRELSVEGSDDGVEWRAYAFRWKPGAADAPPRYAAPHMPRLDWMMWFAALGECHHSPWLFALQQRLLEGAPSVEALFAARPFPTPPRLMRIRARDYRFNLSGERYWDVGPARPFCPEVTLRDGRLVRASPP